RQRPRAFRQARRSLEAAGATPGQGQSRTVSQRREGAHRQTQRMTGPPPPIRPPDRVPPERFQLPVERMRKLYYSDNSFVRTRDVLAAGGRVTRVTMQGFQQQGACLGG